MKIRLAIIIVNYKTPHFVCDCLESINGQIDPNNDRVVIVDNASGDGSDQAIEKFVESHGWNDWVCIVRSKINGGFSAGNNLGIKNIEARYYLLLNSDTILRSCAIKNLLNAAKQHPEIGLISPRLEWPDETPQESCFHHRAPTSEFFFAARTGFMDKLFGFKGETYQVSNIPIRPEWTSFACVLIRREVFNRIGLLDDGYFMYFDDMDFCRRARNEGIAILHWPMARVVHLRGGSSSVKRLAAERKRPPRYWYESRNRYFAKFHGLAGLWIANLSWCAGRLISLARELLKLKQPHAYRMQWIDIWTNALRPVHMNKEQER